MRLYQTATVCVQHMSYCYCSVCVSTPFVSPSPAHVAIIIALVLLAGSGFGAWTGLSHLTCLRLTGCSGLTDAGLQALAASSSIRHSLRELQLPGCRGVGDEGVAAVSAVTGLRVLNLSSNRGLSGRCV